MKLIKDALISNLNISINHYVNQISKRFSKSQEILREREREGNKERKKIEIAGINMKSLFLIDICFCGSIHNSTNSYVHLLLSYFC